uniref:Glutaredoxin n=1 Tax=Timema cristinae TaxID=61476 RepID=A0A7R9D759_TIMCR|nr:unnamed protein product [Timema cristinae]
MVVLHFDKKEDIEEAIRSNDLAVLHFYATWAEQNELMTEVFEELSKQQHLQKCVAEDLPEVSIKHNIAAVPTFVLFKKGAVVDRVDGADAPSLTKKINQQASKVSFLAPKPTLQSDEESLKTRLKNLINAAPVMLFMKGSALEPRCGFSKTIIAILEELDTDYKTFDILSDETVRQGLKTYSDWPTYPQLYVKGELIGGLDIVKEMKENGELEKLLPKKQSLDERLKTLINSSDVIVFMKGDRTTPRCGFSRQLMEILTETGIKFQTFDILTDEEIRQGLKTFSNWPTYPQVYVKGELIGGLDIIKDLKEAGELESSLKGSSS